MVVKTSDYELLSIIVDKFEVSSLFGTNYEAHQKYALPETPVFRSYSQIELSGRILDPVNRCGYSIEISLSGIEPNQCHFKAQLQDFEVKDNAGHPKYRKSPNGNIPVYAPPTSIGIVEKVRGEQRWKAYAWIPPSLLTDILIILTNHSQVYVSINEVKKNRSRLITSISVNTDPEI